MVFAAVCTATLKIMNKPKFPFFQSKNASPSSSPVPDSEADVSVSEEEFVASEAEFASSEVEVFASETEFPLLEIDALLPELEDVPFDSQMPDVQPLATLHENAKFLQDLATRIWRAQKQLDKALQKSDEAQLERFARRFEEIGETLTDYGIEIIDHTGQNYDVGLTLTVLQFEPTPGIARETICETIKPSLRVHGVLIPGQVVVASPIAEDIAPENEADAQSTSDVAAANETAVENNEATIDDMEDRAQTDAEVAQIEVVDTKNSETKNAQIIDGEI